MLVVPRIGQRFVLGEVKNVQILEDDLHDLCVGE